MAKDNVHHGRRLRKGNTKVQALWICCGLCFFVPPSFPQNAQGTSSTTPGPKSAAWLWNDVFSYLNMAGTRKASDFQPLTQPERNRLYGRSLVNPIWYFKAS